MVPVVGGRGGGENGQGEGGEGREGGSCQAHGKCPQVRVRVPLTGLWRDEVTGGSGVLRRVTGDL
ncbi:hypothetical protein GCM10018789_05320 [Streptomyces werraensis]|nr:hypothetical protein GCM10018789_05320 [Streptomyces werraensis]